jgi:hypothetical protein
MIGMHAQLEAWLGRSIATLSGRHLATHLTRGRDLQSAVLDAPLIDYPKEELVRIARLFPRLEIRLREVERMLLNQDLVDRRARHPGPARINR